MYGKGVFGIMKYNVKLLFVFSLVVCMMFAGAGISSASGGILRVAVIDEPPSLDQQVITADLTTMIAMHIFEGLYTFDSNYAPVPMLVQDEEIKNDGKLIVLRLREGVKFHNGKEMTSEDVFASLDRWSKFGTRGPVLFNNIDKMEATGKYEITLHFKQPFAPWKNLMAFMNGGPAIYLKEVAEKAEKAPIAETEYIGTGPYKFVERNPSRYIKLARFDDYVSRTEPSDGYAGKKEALFDEIRFIPVPDDSTRVTGVKAGDYDYGERIAGDLYDTLKDDPDLVITVQQGGSQGLVFVNSRQGILKDNFKLRQALLMAIDMEGALKAAIGPEALWKKDGSIMPEGTLWHTTVGTERYSQGNAEKAKALAKEAGYNGEKISYLATTSYKVHYDSSLVITEQLKQAGFNIDFQIYDWATLVSKRADPTQWDMFFTYHGFVPDPVLFTFMSEAYPGWWTTPEKKELAAKFAMTLDEKERRNIWDQIQKLVYEQVPIMKTGVNFMYDVYSPRLKGLEDTSLIWARFWGVSFK
jgi:peptide/nickel transport system substrate-binding protein